MTKPLAKLKIERLMDIMGYEVTEDDVGGVDRQERDDVFATRGSENSCTLLASSVLRDSSSGDDVVRDCWGEVCGDVVKDGGRKHQREMLRSVVDS